MLKPVRNFGLYGLMVGALVLFMVGEAVGQPPTRIGAPNSADDFRLYPATYRSRPEIASPMTLSNGTEIILAETKDGEFAVVPVTVENGEPLLYSRKIKSLMGKDRQLEIDQGDFPELAKIGWHDESALDRMQRITDIPVSIITTIGRPHAFSEAGFMAADEDIIAVLKGDNRLAKANGLTHPQLAKPLFHIWNLILKEIEVGKWARFYDHIRYVFYNNHRLSFKANGTKGWQISIFQDEIQGSFDIDLSRELTPRENDYLDKKYAHLSPAQTDELKKRLTAFHFSEMAPYYIMRYGFYEGHTDYRADPLTIAFVFGLKTLEEIDQACDGDLYRALTEHFRSPTR